VRFREPTKGAGQVGEVISAVLIVKDEENHIGACLRSMAGTVDEIIVADTGSGDRSREIAASHGARVVDYQWHDNFAAARNHAIDHATGDWILYIDADERMRPYDRRVLEGELSEPALCACTVRFHPRSGFTAYPEHRLFRRDPHIRFQSAIHETIVPDLKRIVASGSGRIGSSQLTIDHLGYDGDQSHKADRNLHLLTKQLQVDPGRIYLWWHLGSVYRDLGRVAEAEVAWKQGADIARQSSGADVGLCFIELIKLRLARGEEALPLIYEAKALQPGNLLLHWLEARALVADARWAEANAVFSRLARVDANTLLAEVSYDRRILGDWALAEMAHCAFRLGSYRKSERWYRRAEESEPSCMEFRIKRQLAGQRADRFGPEQAASIAASNKQYVMTRTPSHRRARSNIAAARAWMNDCNGAYLDETAVLATCQNLREACDFVIHDGTDEGPEMQRNPRPLYAFLTELDAVRDGAVIYVKSDMMDDFFGAAFPRLSARFVLVTAGDAWSTPGSHHRRLDDPRIIRWFGKNCDLPAPHPKFEPIPICFADPYHPHGDQAAMLRVHRRMPPAADKPLKAYASFHLNLTHSERHHVWQRLRGNPEIVFEPRRIPPELLWIRHVNYAFEICPRGAGPDCHRTWEALLLRTIPIVQSSRLDPLYEGFPVVIIDDWDEITPASMLLWRDRLPDRFTAAMFERLTCDYWIDRIRKAAGCGPLET